MFNPIQKKDVPLNDTYVCLSTDTKVEDDCGNGDMLIEMDTGKVYFFNVEGTAGNRWLEVEVGE